MNGRFGGEEGLIQRWGVSLDAAVAFVGHVGGFAFSFADDDASPRFDVLAEVFHTVGDTGLASGVYRFFHKRGLESAARAPRQQEPGLWLPRTGRKEAPSTPSRTRNEREVRRSLSKPIVASASLAA